MFTFRSIKHDSSTLSVKFLKVSLNVMCLVMSPLRYSNFFTAPPCTKIHILQGLYVDYGAIFM